MTESVDVVVTPLAHLSNVLVERETGVKCDPKTLKIWSVRVIGVPATETDTRFWS